MLMKSWKEAMWDSFSLTPLWRAAVISASTSPLIFSREKKGPRLTRKLPSSVCKLWIVEILASSWHYCVFRINEKIKSNSNIVSFSLVFIIFLPSNQSTIPDIDANLTVSARWQIHAECKEKAELNMQISYLAPTRWSCYHFKLGLTSDKNILPAQAADGQTGQTFEWNPLKRKK